MMIGPVHHGCHASLGRVTRRHLHPGHVVLFLLRGHRHARHTFMSRCVGLAGRHLHAGHGLLLVGAALTGWHLHALHVVHLVSLRRAHTAVGEAPLIRYLYGYPVTSRISVGSIRMRAQISRSESVDLQPLWEASRKKSGAVRF